MPYFPPASGGGGASGPTGYESYRMLGISATSTLLGEKTRGVIAGQIVAGGLSSITASQQRCYGMPFFNETATTLTAIQTAHPTAPATAPEVQFAVYESISPTRPFPGAVLYRTGSVASPGTATVFGVTGLSVPLAARTLYWAMFMSSIDTPVRGIPAAQTFPLFGRATIANGAAESSMHPFGTANMLMREFSPGFPLLPATFPDDGLVTMTNFDPPAIQLTFAPVT